MGVYYLHKDNGEIIFMGKGNNIKNEITNQFLKTTKRGIKIQEKTTSVMVLSTSFAKSSLNS